MRGQEVRVDFDHLNIIHSKSNCSSTLSVIEILHLSWVILISLSIATMIIAEPPKPSLTTLPPELLYQILSAVIDVPYVLDTILPTETCYWHWHPLSHDISEYNRSESQREILRLVCRSWKSYADMSQFRWLSFVDGSQLAKHRKNYRIVERALADADSSQHDKGEDSITRGFNKPRRMDLQIGTQDAYNLTCKLITLLGIKLTTLFISCSAEHASPMFNHLISSRSALPNLRSLMLTHVNFTKTPLQTISSTFFAAFSFFLLLRTGSCISSTDSIDIHGWYISS